MSEQLVFPDKNPNSAAEPAFDVGTSPHGLTANLPLSHQETNGTTGNRFPASQQAPTGRAGVLPLSEVSRQAASASARPAQRHDLELSEAQRRHVSFALLEQIDSLSESYEAHEPEVQDAIRCLQIVRGKLERMGGAA